MAITDSLRKYAAGRAQPEPIKEEADSENPFLTAGLEPVTAAEQKPAPEPVTAFIPDQKTDESKKHIVRSLAAGASSDAVLIAAVDLIGELTQDPRWSDYVIELLMKRRADVQQEWNEINGKLVKCDQLEEQRRKYCEQAKRSITRQLEKLERVKTSLSDVLEDLQEPEA